MWKVYLGLGDKNSIESRYHRPFVSRRERIELSRVVMAVQKINKALEDSLCWVSIIRVLLLSENEIAELLSIEEVSVAVENAFREKALGYAQMPPKVYLNFSKYNGDVRAMPAYLERLDVASVKIVNSHPENPGKFNMPTVSATVLLLDPRNGALLSIMEETT